MAHPTVVGIDIGGTFTDVVMLSPQEGAAVVKVPSVPSDYVSGLVDGITALPIPPAQFDLLVHGTTIATNAIIARTGAETALITNEGFRDILLLRRSDRADQFNLWWQPPEPLVRRRDIFEVPGRVDYRGEIVTEFDETAARTVAREIASRGQTAVAIVFLHSFVNPTMERRMKEILLEEHPSAYVSTSHEILPEILEYERTATTVANAYVGPLMYDYLEGLVTRCATAGYRGDVLICSSSGGVMGPKLAAAAPARTMASGPAAGVVAANVVGAAAGLSDLITFDMGGTSLDVAIIRDGEIQRRPEWMTPDGTPIRFTSVDVTSIGAGGGSIAWTDAAGSLHVGPRSAGSNPGPTCYGLGGTDPTCTDAQLLLGRLDTSGLLGGKLPVYPERAREAVEQRVSEPLALRNAEAGAVAILTVAIHNMVEALRLLTIYRGHDPRDFTLVAYGGAGPMFATAVAREAGIRTVLIPKSPGLLCALGLLLMDIRHEHTQSILAPIDEISEPELIRIFGELQRQSDAALEREGVPAGERNHVLEADLRYFGTTHTLTIPVTTTTSDDGDLRSDLAARFVHEHHREFGYTIGPEIAPIEIATARVIGLGSLERPDLAAFAASPANPSAPAAGTRRAWFDGEMLEVPVYHRDQLDPSIEIHGPAIIEQLDTTTVLEPNTIARVDQSKTLIIEIQ